MALWSVDDALMMSLMQTTTNHSSFSNSHPITCCLHRSSGIATGFNLGKLWQNSNFLFLPSKRTFTLETLRINVTLVLPRAKIFSEFWSNRNIWKWWNLFKIWILTNLCFIKRRQHFMHKSETCLSLTCKVSRSNILLFESNKKEIFLYIYK